MLATHAMTFLMTHILACYAAATVGAIATIVTKRQGLFTASVVAMLIGFGLHSADLAINIAQDGHLPLYGAQEVCSFLGWSLVLYFLIVQLRFPTHALASLVFPTATILTPFRRSLRRSESAPLRLPTIPCFSRFTRG